MTFSSPLIFTIFFYFIFILISYFSFLFVGESSRDAFSLYIFHVGILCCLGTSDMSLVSHYAPFILIRIIIILGSQNLKWWNEKNWDQNKLVLIATIISFLPNNYTKIFSMIILLEIRGLLGIRLLIIRSTISCRALRAEVSLKSIIFLGGTRMVIWCSIFMFLGSTFRATFPLSFGSIPFLLLLGMFFKVGAYPFHNYVVDMWIIGGAQYCVVQVILKIIYFFLIFSMITRTNCHMVLGLSTPTLIVGTLVSTTTNSVNRWLAYCSLTTPSFLTIISLFSGIYDILIITLFVYSITFTSLLLMFRNWFTQPKKSIFYISSFSYIGTMGTSFWTVLFVMISLFGIPPFSTFGLKLALSEMVITSERLLIFGSIFLYIFITFPMYLRIMISLLCYSRIL